MTNQSKFNWNRWPINTAAGVLLGIGVLDFIFKKFNLGAPATTLILIGVVLVVLPIEYMLTRLSSLKVGGTGVEMVLQEMNMPSSTRTELEGLTSHDIWALDDFSKKKISVVISQMKPSQKVAAKTLIDLKLLDIVEEGGIRLVRATELGEKLIDTAKNILC